MEQRLLPVNAVLALVSVSEPETAILARSGFRLAGMEIPVGLGDKGVVIDVLLAHDAAGMLIACEAKSGANIEDEQAVKYSSLDPQSVLQAGSVELRGVNRPSTAVLYACLEQNTPRIALGLEQAGVSAPILSVSPNSVELINPQLAPSILSASFSGPIPFNRGIPRLVPCDPESTQDDIKAQVKSVLISHLSRRNAISNVDVIANETLHLLPFYGKASRNAFRKTVTACIRTIAEEDPATFRFSRQTGNRDAIVEFLRTPEDNDPRGRTQAYQALQRRTRTSSRRGKTDPNQLDLFNEVDSGAETDDDEQLGIEEER